MVASRGDARKFGDNQLKRIGWKTENECKPHNGGKEEERKMERKEGKRADLKKWRKKINP